MPRRNERPTSWVRSRIVAESHWKPRRSTLTRPVGGRLRVDEREHPLEVGIEPLVLGRPAGIERPCPQWSLERDHPRRIHGRFCHVRMTTWARN